MKTSSERSPSGDRSEVEVARINARQVILVTVITAVAGIVGALIQGVFSSHKVEALQTQLATSNTKAGGLEASLKETDEERQALYRLTADYLEGDMAATSGKADAARSTGLSEEELSYRRLRRAVFLNMGVLRANASIAEKTFEALDKRGYKWVLPQKARLLAEFPELRTKRLRWLEDVAIPKLRETIDQVARSPMQQLPAAQVPLPESVQILTSPPGEPPTVWLTNMNALTEEAALLKRSL